MIPRGHKAVSVQNIPTETRSMEQGLGLTEAEQFYRAPAIPLSGSPWTQAHLFILCEAPCTATASAALEPWQGDPLSYFLQKDSKTTKR